METEADHVAVLGLTGLQLIRRFIKTKKGGAAAAAAGGQNAFIAKIGPSSNRICVFKSPQ